MPNRLAPVFATFVLLSASAVPSALAGVSDLNISFCGPDGQSSKRLDLTVDRIPWHAATCIRYSNLGTETTVVSVKASDGFVLADGKIGCADDSADSGTFANLVRYEGGDASFSLAPGESAERSVVFNVPEMGSEPTPGCLITAPAAPASSSGGIDVVVRRANVVVLSPSLSVSANSAAPVAHENVPLSSEDGALHQAVSESGTAAGSDTSSAAIMPASSSPAAPAIVPVSESEAPVVKDRVPASLSFMANARQGSVPAWLAGLLALAGFLAGSLAFRQRRASPGSERSDAE